MTRNLRERSRLSTIYSRGDWRLFAAIVASIGKLGKFDDVLMFRATGRTPLTRVNIESGLLTKRQVGAPGIQHGGAGAALASFSAASAPC